MEDKEFREAIRRLMASVAMFVLTLLICILIDICLSGCSRKTVPTVVTETHTTLNADSLTHLIKMMMSGQSSQREKETVYVFDKTTYTVNEQGDTIGKERDRVTDRNREWESKEAYYLHVLDSLSQVKNRTDSVAVPVPYPVEVPVEVDNPPAWWQTCLMWIGGIVIAILAIYTVAKIRRKVE